MQETQTNDPFAAQDTPGQPVAPEDVIGGTGHPAEPTEPEVNPEGTEGEEAPEDNWKVRTQYYQSKASKLENELKELKQWASTLSEQTAVWQPIIKKLQEQPEVLTNILSPKEEGPKIERPVPPEKPKGYSKYEAVNDPNSESAKYEEALVDYQARIAEYYDKKEMLREQELERIRQQEMEAANRNQFVQQTYNKVQADYGLTPGEAAEFIKFSSSPESLSLDNLVGYYKYLKSRTNKAAGTMPTPSKNAEPAPPPATAGGSTGGVPTGEPEEFVTSLKRSGPNLFETL